MRVIVEGFVDFDYAITLLTIRHINGTSYCAPIGHVQEGGAYQQSWQPQAMSKLASIRSKKIAEKVTSELSGRVVFGVEPFIKSDEVFFSEVSPRPHDTGMVTLISQNLSEYVLHLRAVLGFPMANIEFYEPSASRVILVTGKSQQVQFNQVAEALEQPYTDMRLFGKPEVGGTRRMGVTLARTATIEQVLDKAKTAENIVSVTL